MSDIPPPAAVKSSFLRKKVAGVPVLYLLLAGVLILAIVAYRAKNTVLPDTETTDDETATSDDTGSSDMSQTDGGATPTFVANPVPTYEDSTSSDEDGSVGNAAITTNDQWMKKAVEWMVSEGESAGNVTGALQKYLNGDQLSFDEGAIRDKAVRQFGLPPDGFTQGDTGVQVKKVSLPGKHVVQGSADNSYTKLAALYYGTKTQENFDSLQAKNPTLGYADGPFPVGTKVNIPAYSRPKYYTTTKSTNTAAEVAKKNGISVYQLHAMNDNNWGPYVAGSKVRVA